MQFSFWRRLQVLSFWRRGLPVLISHIWRTGESGDKRLSLTVICFSQISKTHLPKAGQGLLSDLPTSLLKLEGWDGEFLKLKGQLAWTTYPWTTKRPYLKQDENSIELVHWSPTSSMPAHTCTYVTSFKSLFHFFQKKKWPVTISKNPEFLLSICLEEGLHEVTISETMITVFNIWKWILRPIYPGILSPRSGTAGGTVSWVCGYLFSPPGGV